MCYIMNDIIIPCNHLLMSFYIVYLKQPWKKMGCIEKILTSRELPLAPEFLDFDGCFMLNFTISVALTLTVLLYTGTDRVYLERSIKIEILSIKMVYN